MSTTELKRLAGDWLLEESDDFEINPAIVTGLLLLVEELEERVEWLRNRVDYLEEERDELLGMTLGDDL